MSIWSTLAANDHAIQLATFGEPITYTPDKGDGTPISTSAVLEQPQIGQSSAPGYFADIRVDPAVITAPAYGDLVTWADGIVYVVAKVARPDMYSMFILAIHRQDDPTDEV